MVKKTNHKISNIKLSKIVGSLGKILGIVVKEQDINQTFAILMDMKAK